MNAIQTTNLALSFILELCLLAALGYWGYSFGSGTAAKLFFGFGIAFLAAIFWGIFMSPKAVVPLSRPLHILFEIILFGLSVAALASTGHPTLAWTFGVLVVINRILAYIG